MGPILRRPFDFADKIVALATSDNLFSYTAIHRLNLRSRVMTDLSNDNSCTLGSIFVLYDAGLNRFSQFRHHLQRHLHHQHRHQHYQHPTTLKGGGRHLAFDPLSHPPIADILRADAYRHSVTSHNQSLPRDIRTPSSPPLTLTLRSASPPSPAPVSAISDNEDDEDGEDDMEDGKEKNDEREQE